MKRLAGLMRFGAIALVVAAIVQQLRRPQRQRTWTGRLLGIPYDFRKPTLERFEQRWWNPKEPNLLTPNFFGVGWSVNLYQVKHQLEEMLG
jgi:hypothetical protein